MFKEPSKRELLAHISDLVQENGELAVVYARTRRALERYDNLLANIDTLLEARAGTGQWNGWMLERDKAMTEARHALAKDAQP